MPRPPARTWATEFLPESRVFGSSVGGQSRRACHIRTTNICGEGAASPLLQKIHSLEPRRPRRGPIFFRNSQAFRSNNRPFHGQSLGCLQNPLRTGFIATYSHFSL